VGVAKDAAPSSVEVVCNHATDPLVEPQADVTTITAVKAKARSAHGRGDLGAAAKLKIKKDGTYRIDATMTLRPFDPVSSDTRCSLIATSPAGSTVLDTTVVRLQAQFDPPPSSSNAFPRLSFTAASPLRAGTLLSVACDPFVPPGYAAPGVDLATIVLTPLAATRMQTAGGPLGGFVSMPIHLGIRYAVTATASLLPISAEALDYRCDLLAGSTVLDSTVVRVQGQYDPPPSASNAFPRLGFTGIVEPRFEASSLSIGCRQIGGSPDATQPTVDLGTITAAQVR
jgi:hypothetical protein